MLINYLRQFFNLKLNFKLNKPKNVCFQKPELISQIPVAILYIFAFFKYMSTLSKFCFLKKSLVLLDYFASRFNFSLSGRLRADGASVPHQALEQKIPLKRKQAVGGASEQVQRRKGGLDHRHVPKRRDAQRSVLLLVVNPAEVGRGKPGRRVPVRGHGLPDAPGRVFGC